MVLTGYGFWKKCSVIATAAGAQNNYPLELIVGESSGTSGADVHCSAHCEDFPNDIRFTKEDGETKHDYWIETNSLEGTTPNRKVTIWIEVASIPASGSVDFYMYYGKSGDGGENDGDSTFDFFENDWDRVAQLQIGSSTYDAFGLLIKTGSDTIIYFTREGTSHVGDKGKIIKQVFTPSTNSWGSRSTVYDDPNANYDSRNVGGGIIGSNIYVFFARYNKSTSAWVDIGYIKSTDLTGSSWGSYTAISVSPSVYSPYGCIIPTANSNTYLQPWYGVNGSTYSVKVFKTINSGTSWSVGSTIYSGSIQYNETCLAYIGSNKIIALLRKENGGYVYQATSSDNGETWSTPVATNLGASSGVKIPWIIYDSATGKVITVYMDKVSQYSLKSSEADANTVYSNGSAWETQKVIHEGWGSDKNGYPSMVKVLSGKYFFVYAPEMSSSDSDTYGCFYPLKWRRYGLGSTFSVSSGLLDFNGKTGNKNANGDVIESIETFAYPHKLQSRYKYSGGAGVGNRPDIGLGRFSYDPISTNCANVATYSTANGTYGFISENGSARTISAPFLREADYAITTIKWKSGEVKYKRGANESTASSNTPTAAIPLRFGGNFLQENNEDFHIYSDWFMVSKYASPEPTWGTWGAEVPTGDQDVSYPITETGKHVFDSISEEGRIVLDGTLLEDGRIVLQGIPTKTSSAGLTIVERGTKESSAGLTVLDDNAIGCVMTFEGGNTYNDQTTAANNATINDVQTMFDTVGDILYYGDIATYAGVKIKYSTKGVIGSAVIVLEYSKGSGVWGTLSHTDESNKFTEDPGRYLLAFTPPGDWATDTVDGKTHYWIRYRLTNASYTINPELDQLWTFQRETKESSAGLRIIERGIKESSAGLNIYGGALLISSGGLAISEKKTKESSAGLAIIEKGIYEDFTTFTEVDVGADRIQKTANHIDHYGCRNETTYLYKDYGASHFWNFTHKIKVKCVPEGEAFYGICWMLANDLGDVYGLDNAGKSFIYLTFYHYSWMGHWYLKLRLTEIHNGTLYEDTYQFSPTTAWHYIKIVKSGTSLTAYIYSDSDYSVLLDTLVLTMHVDGNYKYLYGCNTYNSSTLYKCMATDIENFNLGSVRTKESSAGLSIQETKTKTSSGGLRIIERHTKESSANLSVTECFTKESSASLSVTERFTKESSAGISISAESMNVSSAGLRIIERGIKESSAGLNIYGGALLISSGGLAISEKKTKESSAGLAIIEIKTKASSAGLRIIQQNLKTSSASLTVKALYTKESSAGISIVAQPLKQSSAGLTISGVNTLISSGGLTIYESCLKKGLFYGKLGDVILETVMPESFRISEEINRIPTFEFEVANSEANRTAIAANPTALFKIYWQHHGVDTHIFTGIINADGIEYVSLSNIRITGFASYAKLGWPLYKHLNSEDAEPVDTVFDFHGTYTDYTTQANNATINDVIVGFGGSNHCFYVGEANPFWGLQVKYSTKGIPAGAVVVIEFSKGGGVWETLDALDETNAFAEEPGTYDVIISHPPSDWARNTINGISKFWIRWRVVSGAYSTQPKLNRIHTVNVDVYRVFYLATSARAILLDVLEDTEYTMDAIDACPEDEINLLAEYESPLRVIAAIPAALTWTDTDGSKKSYQWWIDEAKKVHMKKERGTTHSDDITGDLTIFNNLVDYFNISNRLFGFSKRDGLSQIRAIIEDKASQTTHALREIAVPKNEIGKYLTLKASLEKDITYSKDPMQRIKGSVTTEFWGLRGYEVGDRVILHQGEWVVEEGAFQIVKADIGPVLTQLNLGISREHLEGLKSNLKRAFDIQNVQMHGSTSLLTAGPETSNYERKSDGSVFSAKLKIEIPSEVTKTHKVLLSWTIGPYRASVNEQTSGGEGHDHGGFGGSGGAVAGGFAGEGGAFIPDVLDGGDFIPAMLSEAHQHDLSDTLTIDYGEIIINSVGNEGVIEGLDHRHSGGGTGYSSDNAYAVTSLTWGEWCTACDYWLISTYDDSDSFATASHYHQNSDTGYTSPNAYIEYHPIYVVFTIHPYVLQTVSNEESPAHLHDGVYEPDHGHDGITEPAHNDHSIPAEPAHEDHVIITEPGGTLDIDYGIFEIPAGTVLELIINGEKKDEYVGDQQEIRVDGYLTGSTNTIEIQPISSELSKKGSATISGACLLFIEPKKF